MSDDDPMTPEQIAWVRSQRITNPPEDEDCRVPGVDKGTCAYAGFDGKDACGQRCIWTGPMIAAGEVEG